MLVIGKLEIYKKQLTKLIFTTFKVILQHKNRGFSKEFKVCEDDKYMVEDKKNSQSPRYSRVIMQVKKISSFAPIVLWWCRSIEKNGQLPPYNGMVKVNGDNFNLMFEFDDKKKWHDRFWKNNCVKDNGWAFN